jgi:hypothetical protein
MLTHITGIIRLALGNVALHPGYWLLFGGILSPDGLGRGGSSVANALHGGKLQSVVGIYEWLRVEV